jgi:hypothetical protein
MTGQEFAAICSALWGPNWRGSAAEELGVAYKTVCRWEHDKFKIPEGMPMELAKLCRKHIKALDRIARKLEKETKTSAP